jgi:hypothetical protein
VGSAGGLATMVAAGADCSAYSPIKNGALFIKI